VFAEVFIHGFSKGLAFVERLEFAGQQSLELPAPPPKQDLQAPPPKQDWRAARKAWEDGGKQGFTEKRTDFSEASHGLRDGPPPADLHVAQPHCQVLAATLSLHR
jgi:hypothetical protein